MILILSVLQTVTAPPWPHLGIAEVPRPKEMAQCVCRLLLTLEAHHLPLPHDSSSFPNSDFGNSSLAFLPGLAPPGILQALLQYSPLWPLLCWLMAPSSLSSISGERSHGCSCSAIIAGRPSACQYLVGGIPCCPPTS